MQSRDKTYRKNEPLFCKALRYRAFVLWWAQRFLTAFSFFFLICGKREKWKIIVGFKKRPIMMCMEILGRMGLNISEKFGITGRLGRQWKEGVTRRACTKCSLATLGTLASQSHLNMIHVTWEVSSSRVGAAAAFFCPRNIHFQRFCSGKLCDGKKRSVLLSLFVFPLVVLLCTLSISCGFFWILCFLSLTCKASCQA